MLPQVPGPQAVCTERASLPGTWTQVVTVQGSVFLSWELSGPFSGLTPGAGVLRVSQWCVSSGDADSVRRGG